MFTFNFMKNISISALAILAVLTSCNSKPDYDATGIFEATTVTVSAETQGKILDMPVAEGDSVALGEMICRIDTTLLLFQSSQLGSQQMSAESVSPDIAAQAASLRAQIAHQRNECRRVENLFADGAATQKQRDDAEAALATLQGQLDALLSSLGKNKSSISESARAIGFQQDQVRTQIEKSTVCAPLGGTVLEKYAEAGEYAVPGKPLVKIANLSEIYLRSYFTVSQLADLKLGQKVTVLADFGDDNVFEYPGVITWIAQESEFTPKSIQTADSRANLVYAVKVAVKNDGRLKLGQYGEVRL